MKMYCGNENSEGGRALATALGIKRIKHNGSTYRPQPNDKIINWGCAGDSFPDRLLRGDVLNGPAHVLTSANKRLFFEKMIELPEGILAGALGDPRPRTPVWRTTEATVQAGLNEGEVWVARQSLTGHSGHGIVIMEKPEDFVRAPLYTKYVKKAEEYRVHIVNGQVIDLQRKIRDPEREPTNWRVRSHENGFIYVRGNVEADPDVSVQALRAFRASQLHFGAVDIIFNNSERQAYCLEINTAPGLTGQTVESYAQAFRNL